MNNLLIIDDEIEILEAFKRQLRKSKYSIYTAIGAREGLEILKNNNTISVIICDMRMAEMNGIEFFKIIKRKYPDIIRIALSGSLDIGLLLDAVNHGEIWRFVAKPWESSEIKQIIRNAFDYYHIKKERNKYHSELKEANRELQLYRVHLENVLEERSEKIKLQQKQLILADKMKTLGILVSGVAHEINNPNNFISLNTPVLETIWQDIQIILDKYYCENADFEIGGVNYLKMKTFIPELLTGIKEGSYRIEKIVSDLKTYARENPLINKKPVKINDILKKAIILCNNLIKKSTDNFKVQYKENVPMIAGDFQKLEQVIINVIQNSCQALENKIQSIKIKTTFDKKENLIIIVVKDQGIGIKKDDLSFIMDPFYTTKRGKGGTGLGLSISSSIINEHNGSMEVTSEYLSGTSVIISLPVVSE